MSEIDKLQQIWFLYLEYDEYFGNTYAYTRMCRYILTYRHIENIRRP